MKSKMLEAWLKQHDVNKEEKIKDEINKELEEKGKEEYNKAYKRISSSGNILKLEDKGLNNPNEVHENFKNYDHSLEMDRLHSLKMKK